MFGFTKKNTASAAVSRLDALLTSERAGVRQGLIDSVNRELSEVLNKYFEIDKDKMKTEVRYPDESSVNPKDAVVVTMSVPILQVKEKSRTWD